MSTKPGQLQVQLRPAAAQTDTTYQACYVPSLGALYLIGRAPLPSACLAQSHVPISWTDGSRAVRTGTPAGGDLRGTYPNPRVAGLQGTAVDSARPTSGQVLRYNGMNWAPGTATVSGDAGGDLHGRYPNPTVVGLQGRNVSAAAPVSGGVLVFDSAAGSWGPGTHASLAGLTSDDHTQYLLGDGARHVTNGFAVSGTVGVGSIPATGTGSRLMWYPGKAAFRAGYTDAGEWDDGAIGRFSTAFGSRSVALGYASTAMGQGTVATGNSSTAMGSNTDATGVGSTAMGDGASASGRGSTATGSSTASGVFSVALGSSTASGNNSTAMSAGTASGLNSTAIGYGTSASGDHSIAMGSFASTAGHIGSFVYADIYNSTTFSATADHQFAVRASGGFQFFTTSPATTGCSLAAGSGSWSCTSSRSLKTDFEPLDGEDVLARVRELPVQRWSYRGEPGVRHLGTFAESFYRAFGLGTSATSIGHSDMDGVNLAAVQALERRTRELQGRVHDRDREIAALNRSITELRRRLERLEAPGR